MHRTPRLKTRLCLKDELFTHPYRFEFAQAMRLLHLLQGHETSTSPGSLAQKEIASFKSRVFLSAPPSDIYRIKGALGREPFPAQPTSESPSRSTNPMATPFTWRPPARFSLLPKDTAHQDASTLPKKTHRDQSPLEVQINFLGIAGIQGPLPTPYTELILSRMRQKDFVMRDFLDIFNSRLVSIHYRIAQKLHPALSIKPPEKTPIGRILFHLLGVGTPSHTTFPTRDLLPYTRFFWKKPHTPTMLQMILQHYFGYPATVFPFQGRWFPLETYKQTAIAVKHTAQNNRLGHTTVVGKRVWCEERAIMVGLILDTPENFRHFLPTGRSFPVLKNLIHAYVGSQVAFKVGLKLTQKPPSRLSNLNDKTDTSLNASKRPLPFILGWTSWLLSQPSVEDSPWVVFK